MKKKTLMYEQQKRSVANISEKSKSIDLNSNSKFNQDLTPRTAS